MAFGLNDGKYSLCLSLQLSVPSSLNLLPGQIHMMRETVETERERRKTLSPTPAAASSSNLYLSLVGDMPA